MDFREATQADLDYMAEHSINHKVDRKLPNCVDYVFTLEHEGNPLVVGGFRMIVPTTAWCWIDLSKEAKNHLTTVYRVIKEWIDEFAKNNNINRLQAFIRTDYVEAERLVKHLGFERESIMKGFFGDKDAYMYVRLK